ncbi:hypothetical protein NFI96_031281 [Prochilodus magdalenae]|nr:hypothetical protein NFI96_031281 [Prochilodus magdalenae]
MPILDYRFWIIALALDLSSCTFVPSVSRMPLDLGCVGERPARPASKNAKDKSNSAALLASRVRTHMQQEVDRRESRCSSEKDSGYSDTGSDSLQTDAEDQRSVSETKLHKPSGVQSVSDQGKRILVSAPPELTPIFILKNVVLKQVRKAMVGRAVQV